MEQKNKTYKHSEEEIKQVRNKLATLGFEELRINQVFNYFKFWKNPSGFICYAKDLASEDDLIEYFLYGIDCTRY